MLISFQFNLADALQGVTGRMDFFKSLMDNYIKLGSQSSH